MAATVFCDEIAKGSRNRNACQHFPNPQLDGVREVIEAVQLGTQDRVDTSTGLVGWWATLCPRSSGLTSPFWSATTTTRAR